MRHIDAEHYYRQPVSSTFHARDVFAPVVAYLAKGVEPAKFGEEITDFVRFNAPKPKPVDAQTLRGVVLRVDRFGNIVTNFTPQDVPALFQANPPAFKIRVGKHEITEIHANYAEGAPNQVFGILGSMGYLEISANRAAAAQIIGVGKGSEVNIVLEGAVSGNQQPVELRTLRLGMDVALHFRGPFQKAPQILALPPGELPELQESDLLHLHPTISFDSPQQVRAAPRSKVVAAGRVPQESEHVAHGDILTDRSRAGSSYQPCGDNRQ